jgi:hypothetical protein
MVHYLASQVRKDIEDMVELFCGKYFQAEENMTLVNLHTTKQVSGEDLLHYIHRFRDILGLLCKL